MFKSKAILWVMLAPLCASVRAAGTPRKRTSSGAWGPSALNGTKGVLGTSTGFPTPCRWGGPHEWTIGAAAPAAEEARCERLELRPARSRC